MAEPADRGTCCAYLVSQNTLSEWTGRRGSQAAGRGGPGQMLTPQKAAKASEPPAPGPGAKMLADMRKKGKPVDPKMEKMAAWLDNLAHDASAGDLGDVSRPALSLNQPVIATGSPLFSLSESAWRSWQRWFRLNVAAHQVLTAHVPLFRA